MLDGAGVLRQSSDPMHSVLCSGVYPSRVAMKKLKAIAKGGKNECIRRV